MNECNVAEITLEEIDQQEESERTGCERIIQIREGILVEPPQRIPVSSQQPNPRVELK